MGKTLCVVVVALVACGLASVHGAFEDPRSPPGPPGAPQTAPPQDRLTLKSGTAVVGTLLDLTEKRVVLEAAGQRKVYSRSEVETIVRSAPENKLALFARRSTQLKKDGTLEDWKGLAAFCKKEGLFPEHRAALREVLRLSPGDTEVRVALGHAELEGKWLDEVEVEAKLKAGFRLEGSKLVSRVSSGRTEVKSEDLSSRYKLLPRNKLSADARKKLEKEREARLNAAEKFLALKEEEYRGVDWSKRHIIKTKHFEIHCNSTYQVARAYGELMEIIRGKLTEMFRSPNRRGDLRSAVFVYASQEEFMRTDMLGRYMGRGLGGYYNPVTQQVTAFHGTFGFTGTTFGVLCHEGTHYYQGLVLNDFDNVPVWLIEGLAVYFGDGSAFDAKGKKITVGLIPRDRLAHIQEKILAKRHTPIAKLVTMTKQGREPFTGSHYADAWALIYFLVNSGEKGTNLLKKYWEIGLSSKITRDHFTTLAQKYFGGVEEMEKLYLDYILKLAMPSAGKVVGDFFVSDTFQFDYKAPSEDWEFFEDREDKRMLVGMVRPNSSAEIRIYYTNNDTWSEADKYFEAYDRLARAKYKEYRYDAEKDQLKAGTLRWYRVRYVDETRDGNVNVSAELGGLGAFDLPGKKKPEEGSDASGKEKKQPREVTRFLCIQKDGVVEIECSARKGEGGQYAEIFDVAHQGFTLCFTRRW